MGDFIMKRTWLGVGVKIGGMLMVGVEDTSGTICNLARPLDRVEFALQSLRLGIGIGGGAGLVALCVFNCDNIWRINKMANSDWGMNLTIGPKWSAMAKALKNYKFFTTIARIGSKLKLTGGGHLENVRNGLHYLYNAYDIGTRDDTPKVVSIDIPVGGAGLEASLAMTYGQIEIAEIR